MALNDMNRRRTSNFCEDENDKNVETSPNDVRVEPIRTNPMTYTSTTTGPDRDVDSVELFDDFRPLKSSLFDYFRALQI